MVAANSALTLSLLDIAKRTDPNGAVPVIAELLSQKNEIIQDIPWVEGNLPTGTRNTLRSGLPQAYWKVANTGTNSSKSTTVQVDEAAGTLEAWSVIDYDVATLNGNVQKYRLTEADAFIESIAQQLAGTMFYGNSATNTERFTGFSPRYGAIANAVNAQNVMTAAGSGSDNTSIWLIGWGQNSVYGVYPRGTTAGLHHEDFGRRPWATSTTFGAGMIDAYIEKWQWKCGLAIKDWRYVVRLANIDVSDLVAGTGTQNSQQLIRLLSRMRSRIPNWGSISPVLYMNRTVQSILMIQALDKSQNALGVAQGLNQFGKMETGLNFLGIPIHTCDQLLNTEAAVS